MEETTTEYKKFDYDGKMREAEEYALLFCIALGSISLTPTLTICGSLLDERIIEGATFCCYIFNTHPQLVTGGRGVCKAYFSLICLLGLNLSVCVPGGEDGAGGWADIAWDLRTGYDGEMKW